MPRRWLSVKRLRAENDRGGHWGRCLGVWGGVAHFAGLHPFSAVRLGWVGGRRLTVYVDELRVWGGRDVATSHLTADTVEELRAFARQHGVPARCWHAGSRIPHYDLPGHWRARLLKLGAVFVPAKEQARVRMSKRRARRDG